MNASRRAAPIVICCLGIVTGRLPQIVMAADNAPALHEQIDTLIEKRLVERKISPADQSDDSEFIRRIYLDLTGVIPTTAQAREFLDSSEADKRRKLIDKLLATDDYALHMARVFDVMLAERRVPATNLYDVPAAAWRVYLTEAFIENRPWDQLVREMLGGEGTDGKIPGASKFYLVRDADPHQITRDVGRVFLGVDLQCAQCHDDPRFAEYRQSEYFGIYAFVERFRREPLSPRGAHISEAALSKTTFTSVFTAKGGETNPKLPGGEMIPDPVFEKGKEYLVKPVRRDAGGVPAYSRRAKLAEQLPRAETPGFSRNIANRLWALFLGRGIIHPLDLDHASNPPSHPELLDCLADWMVDHKFDLKATIREIVLSRTYQRSSILPAGVDDLPDDAFAVAMQRGLTAEQLRWSVLEASGRMAQLMSGPVRTSKTPAIPYNEKDPEWKKRMARHESAERITAGLVTAFASAPGVWEGDFQPIVDQALFLLNSTQVDAVLVEVPGNAYQRLLMTNDSDALAEDLYLSVLTRRPSAAEKETVRELLGSAKSLKDRREPVRALMVGLMLSSEFRLNH